MPAKWRVEAGPARSGVVLRRRIEERRPAADAMVDAGGLHVVVPAGERALGALAPGDVELLGVELLAPFRVTLCDLVAHRTLSRLLLLPMM